MTQPSYSVDRAAGVVTVAFDAPATRNALNRVTRVAIVDLLDELDADPGVRAVILTGVDPAFTSGVDAKEFLGVADYVPPAIDPATALRRMSTPVIAAVNGPCVSGGLEIALACSFILASDRARFADTHARLGLVPGWGLSAELPARVGVARARQLTFTALPVDAATALAWGLVNEVVAHDELLGRARELAAAVAAIAEPSIRTAAALYRDAHDADRASAHALERRARDAVGQSVSPPST